MRFVADVGFPVSGVQALRERGHDVLVLADQGLERLPDDEILTLAREEERVLLGFDLDFGELLAGHPAASPSVVLFRLRDQRPPAVVRRLLVVVDEADSLLREGVVLIVEESRYRVRRLPIG